MECPDRDIEEMNITIFFFFGNVSENDQKIKLILIRDRRLSK